MTVGETIRAARLRRLLTQAELARLIGVRRSTVSAWEQNKSYPSRRSIGRIWAILKVELTARSTGPYFTERASYLKAQAVALTEGMDPGAKPPWGFRLRLCRLRLGLSQRELAGIYGFSQAVISQYELGVLEPPPTKRTILDQFMEENQ